MIASNILNDTLDELAVIRTQLQQARALDRTARFYELTLAGPDREIGTRHAADVLELSGGWCVVHWLREPPHIGLYHDIRAVQASLCAKGKYLLAWQDTSEHAYIPASRSSVVNEILTETETEILHLICRGLTNCQISTQLVHPLSETTVKNYLTRVFQKLGVRSRMEAAMLARDRLEKNIPL